MIKSSYWQHHIQHTQLVATVHLSYMTFTLSDIFKPKTPCFYGYIIPPTRNILDVLCITSYTFSQSSAWQMESLRSPAEFKECLVGLNNVWLHSRSLLSISVKSGFFSLCCTVDRAILSWLTHEHNSSYLSVHSLKLTRRHFITVKFQVLEVVRSDLQSNLRLVLAEEDYGKDRWTTSY